MDDRYFGGFMAAAGVAALVLVLRDADVLHYGRKGARLARLIGRGGARAVYGLTAIGVIAVGLVRALGGF